MVVRRLAMVVGSQCDALGALSFLPEGPGPIAVHELPSQRRLALELLGVLVGGPGECDPVRVAGESAPGLLLNPSQRVADAALESALTQAHEQEAVLLVCFVGHGTRHQADPADPVRHLLHLWDTSAQPIDTEDESRGWDPYATVDRRRPYIGGLVGLVLLVDACYASWAKQRVDSWSGVRGGLMAAWLGSSGDHEAWDACFSKTLVRVLDEGLEAAQHPRRALVPELLAVDLEATLIGSCPNQSPRLGGHQSHNPALFVVRNRRASALSEQLGLDAGTETLLLRHTQGYVTFAVDRVVAAVRKHRVVAVVGPAGSGKSALAAALRHPPPETDDVPLAVVQAVVFLHEGSSVPEIARTLQGQLVRLPAFPDAARRAEHANVEGWASLTPWQRLLATLRYYPDTVRLLLDGLDQLDGQPGHPILLQRLAELVGDGTLDHVKLVLTGRSVPPLDGIDAELTMPLLDVDTAARYLAAHGIHDPMLAESIGSTPEGNWLILELAANTLAPQPSSPTQIMQDAPATRVRDLASLYADVLETIRERHGQVAVGLLAVLTAAGAGPVLPFELFRAAIEGLGHSVKRAELHAIIGDPDLKQLLDRTHPGTAEERLGMFHQTLTDYFARQLQDRTMGDQAPTLQAVHGAITDAIDEIAPLERHTTGGYRLDPLLQYAFAAAASHVHNAGRTEQVVVHLRPDPIPAVNLARHTAWVQTIRDTLGPDHPTMCAVRGRIAYWTWKTGNAEEALAQFRELLPDWERVVGADDRSTLMTRGAIAALIQVSGRPDEALTLFQELLADRERILGTYDRDTLVTRANIAFCIGEEDPDEALQMFLDLLIDQERELGPDDPDTLSTRANIAHFTAETGDLGEAMSLSRSLLPEQERVLGREHPDSLSTRSHIAYWTEDADESLLLYKALLLDQERALGLDHPETLETRAYIASVESEGDA